MQEEMIIPNEVSYESITSGSRVECSKSRTYSSASRSNTLQKNYIRESGSYEVSTFGIDYGYKHKKNGGESST